MKGHAYHTYRLTSPDGLVSFEFQVRNTAWLLLSSRDSLTLRVCCCSTTCVGAAFTPRGRWMRSYSSPSRQSSARPRLPTTWWTSFLRSLCNDEPSNLRGSGPTRLPETRLCGAQNCTGCRPSQSESACSACSTSARAPDLVPSMRAVAPGTRSAAVTVSALGTVGLRARTGVNVAPSRSRRVVVFRSTLDSADSGSAVADGEAQETVAPTFPTWTLPTACARSWTR